MIDKLKEFTAIPINCLWIAPDELIRTIERMKGQDESRIKCVRLPLDLKNIYFPEPSRGGVRFPKSAIWKPAVTVPGSVLIPNCQDGRIQLMRHLNRRFGIRYFNAYLARDHREQGFCGFEHADESGNTRIVYVIQDPKWMFFEKGNALNFENQENYKARKIADRLTSEIVIGYLESLGWDLASHDFWRSRDDAWVVTELGKDQGA